MEYATDATDARVINVTTPLTQISNRNIQICLAGIKFLFIFKIHATFVMIIVYLFVNAKV